MHTAIVIVASTIDRVIVTEVQFSDERWTKVVMREIEDAIDQEDWLGRTEARLMLDGFKKTSRSSLPDGTVQYHFEKTVEPTRQVSRRPTGRVR